MTQAPLSAGVLSLLMPAETLGTRLQTAMERASLSQADVARASGVTEATVSNWLNDRVVVDHVKASMLFRIADAVRTDPRLLLDGKSSSSNVHALQDAAGRQASQDLQLDTLTIAFQLVEEALEGRTQPPQKRAEMVQLCLELLDEGLPRAKVLRFARSAAA